MVLAKSDSKIEVLGQNFEIRPQKKKKKNSKIAVQSSKTHLKQNTQTARNPSKKFINCKLSGKH
jgi:hypothetical protein